VRPLTSGDAKQYNLDENDKGMVVADVDEGRPAADADLRPGDLITEVDRQPVTDVNDFQEALAKARDKDSVLILAKRDGASRFVILRRKEKWSPAWSCVGSLLSIRSNVGWRLRSIE
jgi:serine protease Do